MARQRTGAAPPGGEWATHPQKQPISWMDGQKWATHPRKPPLFVDGVTASGIRGWRFARYGCRIAKIAGNEGAKDATFTRIQLDADDASPSLLHCVSSGWYPFLLCEAGKDCLVGAGGAAGDG